MKPAILRHKIQLIFSATALGAVTMHVPAGAAVSQEASAGELEEIVVTAEKREVNLQKEAEAVSVLSADALDENNLVTFSQLSGQVPGLVVSKNNGFRTVVSMRGLGLQANQNDVADPSVSLHIDGVYIPNDVSMNSNFIDIDHIEVLRGPQGTVFGQNSIGGAISITSKKPVLHKFEGETDVGFGNFDTIQARGMVNIPLGDGIALRFAGNYLKHNGYGTNVSNGQHPDEADDLGVHAQILWQPTDSFSAVFRLNHFGTAHEDGQLQKNILDPTSGAFNIAQDYPTMFYFNSNIFSLTLQYDVPGAILKSISSYQGETNLDQQNNGKTGLPWSTVEDAVPHENLYTRAVTQEINIASNTPNGLFDWIVGAFYLDLTKHVQFLELATFDVINQPINFTVDPANPFANPAQANGFETDTTPRRKSTSAFAQGTYHVTDAVRLTAGARYTKDKVDEDVCNYYATGSGCNPLKFDSSKWTGKAGAEWDVLPGNLLYLTFSRGSKPGGINLSFGSLVKPTYKDETVSSYEFGSKNRFLDNKLQINVAAFHYDYSNLQFQNTDPVPFSGGVSNIAKSKVDGIELEWSALATEHLRIDGNLAYLNTKITSSSTILDSVTANNVTNALLGQGFGLFSPQVVAARGAAEASPVGNPLPAAPKLVANLSASYEWSISGAGTLTSRVDFSHRDSFNYRVFGNGGTDVVPSADQLNWFLGWKPASGQWNAALIVTNLADKVIVSSRYTDSFGVGATSNQYLPPRLYMLRLGYRF